MKDRITEFLIKEGISPAEFADKIGVQRSSVSHVLNGRNNPSTSFIQKMLEHYKMLNPRWLLLGEGTILSSNTPISKQPTLFQFSDESVTPKSEKGSAKTEEFSVKESVSQQTERQTNKEVIPVNINQTIELKTEQALTDLMSISIDNKEVERIVLFFSDKTFAAYTPSK